nr:hypothetical protein HmN_000265300 [Hymenolepis microstoma]
MELTVDPVTDSAVGTMTLSFTVSVVVLFDAVVVAAVVVDSVTETVIKDTVSWVKGAFIYNSQTDSNTDWVAHSTTDPTADPVINFLTDPINTPKSYKPKIRYFLKIAYGLNSK